ncbi:MAG: M20 family metallopeptidase [Terriglobia bacterium]
MSAKQHPAQKGNQQPDCRALLKYCQSQLGPILRCLVQAVEIESPTNSKPAVDRLAAFFAEECRKRGGAVQLWRHKSAGNALTAEFWGSSRGAKPILLLGHLDTVWELGAISQMPFRVRKGRAYGPGILDMKAGVVCALWAVDALRAAGISLRNPVRLFLNADEETGSSAFRSRILAEARKARACLVLEPAAECGALKTSRKGVGQFRIVAEGRLAHAGINPGAGVNAINELAHQLVRLEEFAGRGVTLNAGVIVGGTRPNVVPERATAHIDVRIPRVQDGKRITRQIMGLKPVLRGARLHITGGINRPPMERRVTVALFEQARELGRSMGLDLQEASTGGGSDGSFAAALGVPTLDGLGAVGAGAHARHEHVIIRELPRRAALLAAMLATV